MAGARAPIDLSDLDPFAVAPAKPAPAPLLARARSPVVVHGPSDPLSAFTSTSGTQRPSPVPSPSSAPLLPDFAPAPRSPPRGIRRPTRRLSSSSTVPTVAQTVGSAADFVAAFKASSPPASDTLARIRRTSEHSVSARDVFQNGAAARSGRERGPSMDGLAASFEDMMHAARPVVSSVRQAFAGISFDDDPYASKPAPPPSFSGAPGFAGQRIEASRRPTKAASFDVDEPRPPVELHGVREGLRSSLDEDLAEAIRPSLPPRLRIARTWTLLYSLDQHGTSVSTLYSRVHAGARATEAACLVLVRDDRGHRFGAFVNEPLRRSDSFYGSGESFLYREERFAADDFRIGGACRTYGWTGRNTYCALTDDTALAFGGGDGHYGLWIDGAGMDRVISAPCPTFENEPLCPGGKATVVALEVWRIGR